MNNITDQNTPLKDIDGNGAIKGNKSTKKKTTKDTKDTKDTSHVTSTSNTTTPMVDQDVLDLRAKPLDEQLWFFIDDVVPTNGKDTEIILGHDGFDENGIPTFNFVPKSMEIFEEIANIPNHVATSYPTMVKYFADIIRLYNDYVKQDINPFWSIRPLQPDSPAIASIIFAIEQFGKKGFLSLEPKPQSIPCRLLYGDSSHKHDFVGIVYMYAQ